LRKKGEFVNKEYRSKEAWACVFGGVVCWYAVWIDAENGKDLMVAGHNQSRKELWFDREETSLV
jgi:hypothetical protein